MYKLSYIVNTILMKGRENGVLITPMKLQKLLYFWYKRYYKKTGESLFADRFEPWPYGPVVQEVYDAFKNYKGEPIASFMMDEACDIKYYNLEGDDSALAKSLEEIWDKYASKSGVALSRLTHTEGSAWYQAYKGNDQFISDAKIKEEEEL